MQLWDFGKSDLESLMVIDEAHSESITGISMNPKSNKSFVTCSEDKSVLMWDITSPIAKAKAIYEGHDESYRTVHFGAENETGGNILAGDDVGCLHSYDPRNPGKILNSFMVGSGSIKKIKFNG